jgi:p-hydroxybenzoate 3-monooxygenase
VRTQVGIVGAGPAGLTLAMLLDRAGIEFEILEARSRDYVEKRVRAGLLEQNTVDLLRELGVADRLDREGLEHSGVYLRHHGGNHHVDMADLTGRHITIYGQQEVVRDLIAALLERGGTIHFDVKDVQVHDLDSAAPRIVYSHDGADHKLECDLVAGCDGFHGVCRESIVFVKMAQWSARHQN